MPVRAKFRLLFLRTEKTILLFLLLLAGAPLPAPAAEPAPTVGGLPPLEALRLGERMYREGLLPSGEPMEGIVQEDIPVDGRMFSCQSCHLRSGVGSIEGQVITLPTNGEKLFKILPVGQDEISNPPREKLPEWVQGGIVRPAYTEETLARALLTGVDPAGRELSWTMPRYALDEREMDILIFYLKNLSSRPSPGVTDTAIRFATVIAGNVAPEWRQAMQAPLEAFVRDWNAQPRRQGLRARKPVFFRNDKWTAYRQLELAVWELKGAPKTWREQLEEHYRRQPVFALLGGVAEGEWAPIHRFCEQNRIPALFPVTDLPVVSDTDWYTLYFSKGLYQEGDAAARFLDRHPLPDEAAEPAVVQVYRDVAEGRALAEAFRESWTRLGHAPPGEQVLSSREPLPEGFFARLAGEQPGAVLLLWLGAEDFARVGELAFASVLPARVVASSTLLGPALFALPEEVRGFTCATYPYSLPQEDNAATVERWLKVRNIPVLDLNTSAKMYFIGWILPGPLMMMRNDYYREYFFDLIDMMTDQDYASAVYPRLSFGPGQRYASKGCYIVRLGRGPEPALEKVTDWVLH